MWIFIYRSLLCFMLLHLTVLVYSKNLSIGPKYVMTKDSFDAARSALEAHKKLVNALPDLRNGSTPQFFLHPVGSRVHGTVVFFHGSTLNAATSTEQARQLYKLRFNTVAFNLAGHAQTPDYWPSTVMRDTAGYVSARKQIKSDPTISSVIKRLEESPTQAGDLAILASIQDSLVPIIFRALNAPRFSRARRALRLLAPSALLNTNVDRQLSRSFFTNHSLYDADGLYKLHLVQSLPGPLHAIGYSFGGSNVVRLAALSQALSRTVLLAPFFGKFKDTKRSDLNQFLTIAGALDLLRLNLGSNLLRRVAAFFVYASSARRDVITRRARGSSDTLCILAEDDLEIDISVALEVCRGKLGGRAFVYPQRLKIGHTVTPETGNRYSDAMMEQIANFLVNNTIDENSFLVQNSPKIAV